MNDVLEASFTRIREAIGQLNDVPTLVKYVNQLADYAEASSRLIHRHPLSNGNYYPRWASDYIAGQVMNKLNNINVETELRIIADKQANGSYRGILFERRVRTILMTGGQDVSVRCLGSHRSPEVNR
jgi:hypothetical protein